MEVSIITSLFNRLDLTCAWLESLERTLAGWRYEVILIDDGSTDGTREFLATLSPERYRVVLNAESGRGFAANNNAGARLAVAPLLCLLNNDTVLLPGWLEPMVRLAQTDRRVALVGNVQREPVSGLIDHCGVYFRPGDGHPLHAGKNTATPPEEAYLCWPAVTAACCVVRRAVFEELGGFDEAFHNGFEDMDFCLRAGQRGYRHAVANRSTVYHYISASPGRRRHEDRNYQLFQERWRGRVPTTASPLATLELRREGRRYLRKHRFQPWRYNFGRVVRALEQRFAPWPRGSRLPWWVRHRLDTAPLPARPPAQAQPSGGSPTAPVDEGAPSVFLVVDDTVQNPGRSGIQTVVRGLAAALGRRPRVPVRTVLWKRHPGELCPLPPKLSAGLAAEPLRPRGEVGVPLHGGIEGRLPPPGAWVLMPELMYRGEAARLVDYVHLHGWRLAVVFYDAIPVTHPQYVPAALTAEHTAYMEAFARVDLLLPISEDSARAWEAHVAARGLPRPAMRTCPLAGDISGAPRVRPEEVSPPATTAAATASASQPSTVRMLCVSTLEPRKNHHALLAAYELAAAARPGLRLELELVGAPYTGAEEIAELVGRFAVRHAGRVRWHEQLEYSLLRRLYEECDFTVYPSLLEGFGLPIIESLWFGRPCVCANFGVMAETAAGGGCLTADVRDPAALAEAILVLADSPPSRHELALAATRRHLKTWDEYAADVLLPLRV